MENPATWGAAEHVVSSAINEHSKATAEMVIGLSLARTICDALRQAGLIDTHPADGLCHRVALSGDCSYQAGHPGYCDWEGHP